MSKNSYDVIIIGGGFYGCSLALLFRQRFDSVLVIEKEKELLTRASYVNQARVHNGYHYPRSIITALRSRVNFPRFIFDFRSAIDTNFEKIYAIARTNTKVNARQFKKFCENIGAECHPLPQALNGLFAPTMIETAFRVKEYAFNAVTLRDILKRQLESARVEVRTSTLVERVFSHNDRLGVELVTGETLNAALVINCAYSQINTLLLRSQLEMLPMRHEITEMALIEVPQELRDLGITIMDGPFFSVMPFPARGLHSLSHVRYTPHESWEDQQEYRNPHEYLQAHPRHSNFPFMVKDAQRFIPSLKDAVYHDSLYEVKTVLLQNEVDDGRPILFRKDYGLKNFSVIMGGKIDNIYDIIEAYKRVQWFIAQQS